MNCTKIKEQLVDFIYDEMTPQDRAAFSDHLRECGTCSSEISSYQKTLSHARAALGAPLAQEPPSRVHLTVVEAAKAVAPRPVAAKAKAAKNKARNDDEPGFFARLLRTPWLLPAFGAAGVATVFFLVRVLKNPEVLPGQRPQSLEERAVIYPEPSKTPTEMPGEEVSKWDEAKVQAPQDKRKQDEFKKKELSEGKLASHLASTGAKKASPKVPLSSATNGAGTGGPRRFAEPPPPRTEPRGKSFDDLLSSSGKADRDIGKPPVPITVEKDKKKTKESRGEDLLLGEPFDNAGPPAKQAAAPSMPRTPAAQSTTRSYAQPPPPPAPAYAPAAPSAAKPSPPREVQKAKPSNYSYGEAVEAVPASPPKPARSVKMEQESMADVDMASAEAADYDVARKDRVVKPASKMGPSLDESTRKADKLFADQSWNAAAEAYRDILRHFPTHKDAPKWRARMNEALIAEQRRQQTNK
jgi:hypothetical protein